MATHPDANFGAQLPEKSAATGSRPYVVLALLFLAGVLNFIDRKMPIILFEQIKADLNLSDTAMGALTGLWFTSVYAISILFVGRLSDRFSRKWIIAGSVTLWSIFTALGGLCQTYAQLVLTRMGVAMTEAGSPPTAQSLIIDYFPPHKRSFALSVLVSAGAFGSMTGLMLGGWLSDVTNWRTSLMIVGLPGIVLGLVIALVVKEPARGATDVTQGSTRESAAVVPARKSVIESLRDMLRYPTARYLLVGCAFFSAHGVGTTTFLPAFFMRFHDMSASQVGLGFGFVMGFSGGIGVLVGGYVSDKASLRNPRNTTFVPLFSGLMALPLLSAGILMPDPWIGLSIMVAGFVCTGMYYGPSFAMFQTLADPLSRGLAAAVMYTALQGVGGSLGPLLVGTLSDAFSSAFGDRGIQYALLANQSMLLFGAVAFYMASRHIRQDLLAREQA